MGTLFVSEHPVMRAGISVFLEGSMPVETMGWSEELEARFQQIVEGSKRPDLLIVDLAASPALSSVPFDFVERLRESGVEIPIVVMSVKDDPTSHAMAVAAGAHYINRGASKGQLLELLSAALRGDEVDHRGLKNRLAPDDLPAAASKMSITSREYSVLRLIACGLSNQRIANILRISIETVKEHAQNIFRKLSVADRTQAATWAIRNMAA